MASVENLVILVKGQIVKKGTLVDVAWHVQSPVFGKRPRRAVSIVHEVGELNSVSGMLISRKGKPTAVLTHNVDDLRVIKRKY